MFPPMSTTSTLSRPICCPECGCAGLTGAARGLTCTACGLVVEEADDFVVHDQMGKDGVVSSHAVLHANTTTLVGTFAERADDRTRRLSRTQQRAVSYGGAKESRLYHLVNAAVAGAQLPPIVAGHALHAAREIAAAARRGSGMAGPEMLAALGVASACKRLGMARCRDELLAVAASLGVEAKPFLRNLLRSRAAGVAGAGAAAGAAAVDGALSALREALGPGDWLGAVSLVHARVAKALVGLRADSAAAVTAYLAAQLVSPAGVPLTLLAKAARFRTASLYNAVKRVLRKLGVVVEGPMSKAHVGAVLRSRLAVGGGIVKEVPVEPMSAPKIQAPEQPRVRAAAQPVPAGIPRAIPKAAIRPVRATRRLTSRRISAALPIQSIPIILELFTPHGRAFRSLRSLAKAGKRARHGPPAWYGSAGPPLALATGA